MAEGVEEVQRAFTAYAIERKLGSGGMATVYLAHDKKHDRKIAIKILHAELAALLGPDRFLREIRVTANLQHPHILGLIDSGIISDGDHRLNGRPYYVMPYVDGESLRQRLDSEPQLPIPEAVRVATEIASALDYAHRHGVIHRDIKPENILLHDGSVLVADFGIALAITQTGGERLTQSGVSLGTPTYMSPEQAMGERAVTPRSDIYSLGAVTYEMLAGEPPFRGVSPQAVIAKVMTDEPRPLTAHRRSVSPHVSAAVSRALEKVPADRFASAHEFADALNNASFTLSSSPTTVLGGDRSNRRLRLMLYAVTALAILMTAATLWSWSRPAPSKQVVRYILAFDSTDAPETLALIWGRLALSPDGSRLAYVGGLSAQLLVRPLNQLHSTAIPGTDGAQAPFFSPDGERLGFFSGNRLRITSLTGGPPVTVTDSLVGSAGASWGRDGFIYTDGVVGEPLMRVEAKPNGVPRRFTVLDTAAGEIDHSYPDVLPNGKGVLFTVGLRNGSKAVAVAEISSGKHRILLNNAIYARYAASGHLLYVSSNKTLMVAPFDQDAVRITGEATALIEGMRVSGTSSVDLAVSATGTLVYTTGGESVRQELVWLTRDGKAQSVDPAWQGDYFIGQALSPDGKRVAVATVNLATRAGADIWVKQLDRGPTLKLTLEDINYSPTWTPDGRSVTFSSNVAGSFALWTKRADGSVQAVRQFHHEKWDTFNPRWSPDGKWLIFQNARSRGLGNVIGPPGSGDILGIRPGVDTVPVPLVATKFTELSPAVSPDGRWLAYTSDETGRYEIYVVPFPNTSAAKWAVSASGGTDPQWSHSGRELFYRDGAGNLVAHEVQTTPTFSLGRSTALFPAGGVVSFGTSSDYAVASDDRRFLMIRPLATTTPDKMTVVENWFEDLKPKLGK